MTDEFFLYLNHIHSRAIVHHGSCGYCNWGEGTHGVSDAERRVDEWHSYATLDEALEAARASDSSEARTCGRCHGRPT